MSRLAARRLALPSLVAALVFSAQLSAQTAANPPVLSIGNASVLEGNAGTTTLNVPVTRTGDTTESIGLVFRTDDSGSATPATADTDYMSISSGNAVLPAGATSVNLPITINGDTGIEPNEDFLVHLLSATNAGPAPNFSAAATFAAGSTPNNAAVADFNGDGRADLVVANESSNKVSVRLNTTAPGANSPSFSGVQNFSAGESPAFVTVADFNGDGRPDLAVADLNSDSVSVRLNTTVPGASSASFGSAQNITVAEGPVFVTTGDLNGDGRPDLAVAYLDSANVSVRLNTTPAGATTASFASTQNFGAGSFARFVALTDFNGDGRPDLAVANKGSDNISVRLNTTAPGAASASFALAQNFIAGINPIFVVTGDLNGDGRPDLAVANEDSSDVSVLLNSTPAGAVIASFASAQNFGAGSFPEAVTLRDLNGDGRLDLAVANAGDSTLSVRLNTTAPGAASASFANAQNFAVGQYPLSVTGDDLNGDGRPDLVTANYDGNNVSVLLNTTASPAPGASFASAQDFGAGMGPRFAAIGDLNGDGKPDLAVANGKSDNVSVRLNTTNPGATVSSFASIQNFAVGATPTSVAIGDLNGDGRPDLAATNFFGNNVSVLLNITAPGAVSASFMAAQNVGLGASPQMVALDDFNGDGRLDLAVVNFGPDAISVRLNSTAAGATSASFAGSQSFDVGSSPRSLAVGDFNGDGRPDLAVANSLTNDVSVLLNTTVLGATSASFTAAQNFVVGGMPFTVAAGDLNGDGRPDLVVSNTQDDTVSVRLNTTPAGATSASFASVSNFGVGNEPRSVTLDDLNGDGRLDLAVANLSGGSVSVLLNTTIPGAASPSFANLQNLGVGNGPFNVAVNDLNGDGRPDLAVANSGSTTVSVLLNRLYSVSIATNEAMATILNDDSPALSINDVTHAEGNSGSTAFTFTVSLSQASAGPVLVNVATANGTATVADADYAALPAMTTLSFTPGQTSKTVTVNVTGDTKLEPDETFFVNLSSPSGAVIADGQGQGSIINDDGTPSASFALASQSLGEASGSVLVTVNLSNASNQSISVPFTVSGSADAGDRGITTTSPLSFSPGETSKTIGVSIINDTLDEPDETVVLSLGAPTNAGLGSPMVHTLTIIDNDDPPSTGMTLLTPFLSNTTSGAATDPTPVAGGAAGTYSFNARFCANTGQQSQLYSQTTQLSNNNSLLNRTADGPDASQPGGVGSILRFAPAGQYADGILSPGECLSVPYRIGLTTRTPFSFRIDLRGVMN